MSKKVENRKSKNDLQLPKDYYLIGAEIAKRSVIMLLKIVGGATVAFVILGLIVQFI